MFDRHSWNHSQQPDIDFLRGWELTYGNALTTSGTMAGIRRHSARTRACSAELKFEDGGDRVLSEVVLSPCAC